MKVFGKIFDVLETVIGESPNPITPTEIAERTKMNRPTCSRIIRELTNSGYLIHLSRQKGYTAGPRSATFASQVRYKNGIMERIRPYVKDCAFKLSQSLLFCEQNGMDRYILCHYNYSTLDIQLKKFSYRDLFETATGMVLLAYLTQEEQEKIFRFYKKNELLFFPDLQDFSALRKIFEQIRRDRIFTRDKYRTLQWIAAAPVCKNGIVTAALGLSTPAADVALPERERMLQELKKTASAISTEISTIESAG